MTTFMDYPLTKDEEIVLTSIIVDLVGLSADGGMSNEAILKELIRRAGSYDSMGNIRRVCRKTKRDVEQTTIRNNQAHIKACGFEQIVDIVNDVFDNCNAGRIIELPCEVGTTVYWLNGKIIMQSTIESFCIDETGVSFAHVLYPHDEFRLYGHNLDIDSLGKTWFLSEEAAKEAKQQLAKLEN